MRDVRSTDLVTDGLLLGGVVLLCSGLLMVIVLMMPIAERPALGDPSPSITVTR